MRVVYHPKVQRDIDKVLARYEAVSERLADEFWDELMQAIAATRENPGRSHPTKLGVRRVNLPRFPYNFLFRELPGKIRILVVRHHKRHPGFGTKRR